DESSVGFRFNDGVADTCEVGNALPIHLAVASGTLRATFHCMAGDVSCRELVPVVTRPSKLVHHWAENQAGICGTAGDNDLRAPGKGAGDRSCAKINISALHAWAG